MANNDYPLINKNWVFITGVFDTLTDYDSMNQDPLLVDPFRTLEQLTIQRTLSRKSSRF